MIATAADVVAAPVAIGFSLVSTRGSHGVYQIGEV
jgi:predicted RNA binding protein YcfA (HicA-like mRNA interferase family)